MNRAPVVIAIAVMLVIAALAMPIKQRCGAPGRKCATALDAHGKVHYYYEVEPLGVLLIENLLGSNISLYYTTGEEVMETR